MGSRALRTALAFAAALAVMLFAIRQLGGLEAERPKAVTLLYVGAENCGPCVVWQRGDGAAFHHAPEFAHVSYREVKSPTLFDVRKDENWPADLIVYRQAIGERSGVPLWLIVADGKIVMQGSGLTQWRQAVLPRLKALLR